MAGSVRARPDRGADAYELRVYVGRDSKGRSRQQSRVFHGSRRQAEVALARMVVELEDGPSFRLDEVFSWGPETTINDAIAGWRDNGWDDLSPSTQRRYDGIWKVHIESSIGRRRIAELNAFEIEAYFRKMKAAGSGRETVRYVRTLLNRACRLARKWSGNQLHNPVLDTEIPRYPIQADGVAVRSPDPHEVRALLVATANLDERHAACLRLIAATGMRRGEACALRWNDIDWGASEVTIDESIVSAVGGAQVKSPKSRKGIRRIAVDAKTLRVLADLRDRHLELSKSIGTDLSNRCFVFSAEPEEVTPIHPDTISKAFVKARDFAGVATDVHLHSLRHFQATVIDSVVPERQKQARLGWSTVHMARHYTDRTEAADRVASEHVAELLDGTIRPEPRIGLL